MYFSIYTFTFEANDGVTHIFYSSFLPVARCDIAHRHQIECLPSAYSIIVVGGQNVRGIQLQFIDIHTSNGRCTGSLFIRNATKMIWISRKRSRDIMTQSFRFWAFHRNGLSPPSRRCDFSKCYEGRCRRPVLKTLSFFLILLPSRIIHFEKLLYFSKSKRGRDDYTFCVSKFYYVRRQASASSIRIGNVRSLLLPIIFIMQIIISDWVGVQVSNHIIRIMESIQTSTNSQYWVVGYWSLISIEGLGDTISKD